MSRKQFSWLLLATVVLAVLVLIFPGRTGRESGIEQTVFIPGLAEQVNDIKWLRLTAAGGEVIATLQRENNAWVVEEESGYRADWGLVKTLLSSLSRAEVVEEKTSNPGYYARLGVEDVSAVDAAGVMVEFAGDSGLPAVIIGNSAQGRDGQYARLKSSAKSVLIDTRIDVPRDQIAWLDKTIVDIADAEVVEYEINHPDGESIKAARTSADDENFDLQNIPAGREIKSEWSVDAPANSLAALNFQAVVPAAQLAWESATRFRILTADGLMVESELLTVPGIDGDGAQSEYWLRLSAGVYT
ncbi:MAG: DUF4340 domain-containing protein, partial [Xanthomonadales bacterium]|nr:DUF4340 domain-containing protein [Xanthomonadales bacterium]